MLKIAIAVMLATGVGSTSSAEPVDSQATPNLIGRWRVVGCETNPRHPAQCAQGKIVFEAKRWSVELVGNQRATSAYVVVSTTKDRITISSEGAESVIVFGADGSAQWNPGIGAGRFHTLSFVRDSR